MRSEQTGAVDPVGREREELRVTFDRAAELYDRARPGYPEELIDFVLDTTSLAPGAALLEIGSGTGKATLPFARRGFAVTCIELGPTLAARARSNLAAFAGVEVIEQSFEEYDPGARRFDLVFAATSWRWLDPDVRYQRAEAMLVPNGFLAMWDAGQVAPDDGDPFFEEIRAVYDEIGEPSAAPRIPRPGELADRRDEIAASGLFEPVALHQFHWAITYTADEYIDLLQTFSNHIAMQQWQVERLHSEVRRRIEARPDRTVRRHWGAVVHVARLVSSS